VRRDRAYQTAKLANAVLAAAHPDPEHAAALALSCVDTVRTTGSGRVRTELQQTSHTLTANRPDL
jgi:hypothetical protein